VIAKSSKSLLILIFASCVNLCSAFADSAPNKLGNEAYSILNRACFECHGRDRQDGGLRLDSREAILEGGDSGAAVDLKDISTSELLRRIKLTKSDSEVMPKRGAVLTKAEVVKIELWLKAGATWSEDAAKQTHWSYVAPKQATLPRIENNLSNHPIDGFVLKRLQEEGLTPAADADPAVLARRLYFDIIGLPPTPTAVDAFVAEASQKIDVAVNRLVEELLDSPQYGEKWARPWLDAARYADSHGFQRDDFHEIWAYRDWVIQALNEDMPFDQFTIEQLAGDLLPSPSESQLIATGFNRCAPCNVEAGTEPEENRFNQVVDRVNTLGYAWLGSSLECAQCHDHKYDPFTQKDYYGLFAFFNQTAIEAERAKANVPGSIQFIGPYMPLTNASIEAESVELEKQIAAAKAKVFAYEQRSTTTKNVSTTNASRLALKPLNFESVNGASHDVLDDSSILLHDDTPDTDTYIVNVALPDAKITGLLLEALTHSTLPGRGPGRGDEKRPNFVLNTFEVRLVDGSGNPAGQKLSLVDAESDFHQNDYPASNAVDEDEKTGWAINPEFGKSHWAAFRFQDPIAIEGASQLRLKLVQNFGGARTIGRLRISAVIGDYKQTLPTESDDDPRLAKLRKAVEVLERKRDSRKPAQTLVTREIATPRMSTMFARGDYRSPTEAIEPNTPAVLHAYKIDGPKNRLGLAKWLVSPENPLVGRVIVNRIWGEIFGVGLVSTPEDFGLKGEAPLHPELLDWLAVDLVEQGWSQKKLLKRIVTSRTYRQASAISSDALERDPNNTLLARGPRFRLPAESIRDNALSIAGLLSLKQFGPPIRPPQPDGLWKKVGGKAYDYETSPGEDKYRRGIYVVLKRMSPYPSFITFDATPRLACRVKRDRSNTPLQALTLLNDPVYVEAAQVFAERIVTDASSDIDERLEYAFQAAVARKPKADEVTALRSLYQSELDAGNRDESVAWFAIASTLMNLDETITKE
jgi:hypothetical protein